MSILQLWDRYSFNADVARRQFQAGLTSPAVFRTAMASFGFTDLEIAAEEDAYRPDADPRRAVPLVAADIVDNLERQI